MTRIFKGGTVVMLKPQISLNLFNRFQDALGKLTFNWHGPGVSLLPTLDDYHMTLQFIGRDLPNEAIGDVVKAALMSVESPIEILITGNINEFATKDGLYFVAEVLKTPRLAAMRENIRKMLGSYCAPDDFDFNPHITLISAKTKNDEVKTTEHLYAFKSEIVTCDKMVVKYGKRGMVIDL